MNHKAIATLAVGAALLLGAACSGDDGDDPAQVETRTPNSDGDATTISGEDGSSTTEATGGDGDSSGETGSSSGDAPLDQDLDIEMRNPLGVTLRVSRLSFEGGDIFVDAEVINSSTNDITFHPGNGLSSALRLVDDEGATYNFVEPEGQEGATIDVAQGETIEGTFAFRGPLRGETRAALPRHQHLRRGHRQLRPRRRGQHLALRPVVRRPVRSDLGVIAVPSGRTRQTATLTAAAAGLVVAAAATAVACGVGGGDDGDQAAAGGSREEASTTPTDAGNSSGSGSSDVTVEGDDSGDTGSDLDREHSDAASDMERRVSETLSELDAEGRDGDTVITLPEQVLFEFDQHVLLPDAAATLDGIAEAIVYFEGAPVRVAGHTDSRGDSAYNQALSERRAQAVIDHLVGAGVDASRLTAQGFGETQPIAPNENPDGSDNPAGRAQNRRVEVVIEGVDPADVGA